MVNYACMSDFQLCCSPSTILQTSVIVSKEKVCVHNMHMENDYIIVPTVTLAVPDCGPLSVRNEDDELTVAVQV